MLPETWGKVEIAEWPVPVLLGPPKTSCRDCVPHLKPHSHGLMDKVISYLSLALCLAGYTPPVTVNATKLDSDCGVSNYCVIYGSAEEIEENVDLCNLISRSVSIALFLSFKYQH